MNEFRDIARAPQRALRALAACALAAAGGLSAPAGAQMLDLGADEVVDLGDRSALVARAIELEDEVAELEALPESPALGAAIAARRLAITLLRQGAADPGGSAVHGLGGLKLADGLAEFDGLCAGAGEAALRAFARGAERARAVATDGDADLDSALRDALSELARAATPGAAGPRAWPRANRAGRDEGAVERAAALVERSPLSAPSRAAVEALLDALRHAETRPLHRSQAAELADALAKGLGLLERVADAPWLDDRQSARLAGRLDAGAGALADRAAREGALADIGACVSMLDIFERIDALERARADVRAVRARVDGLLAAACPEPGDTPQSDARDAQAARRAAGAVSRILAGALERRELPAEQSLALDLRGGWGRLQSRAQAVEAAALAVAAELCAEPANLGRPAVTSAIASQLSWLDSLRAAHAAPVLQEHLRRAGFPEGSAAAARLGALLRAMRKEADLDASLAAVTQFSRDCRALLDGRAGALDLATGPARGPAAALDRIAEAETRRWLGAWADDKPGAGAHAARARLALRAIRARDDARALSDARGAERELSRWRAWRLPGGLIDRLSPGLGERAATAAAALEAGDDAAARAALDDVDRDHACAVLVARIARELQERWPADEETDMVALARALAEPPTRGAWFVEHREALARLSILLTEGESLRRQMVAGMVDTTDRRAGAIAAELLRSLDGGVAGAGARPGAPARE